MAEPFSSIGIGRTHARTRVIVLVQDLHIRILDRTTGDLLREPGLTAALTGTERTAHLSVRWSGPTVPAAGLPDL